MLPVDFLKLTHKPVTLLPGAEEAMRKAMRDACASVVYGNYITPDGRIIETPEYQAGSVREGFDFGPAVLLPEGEAQRIAQESRKAGRDLWYAHRLNLSSRGAIIHIPQPLMMCEEMDAESHFGYVDSSNLQLQQQIKHDFLSWQRTQDENLPYFLSVDFNSYREQFPVEASVVIPVRNRRATIADAVNSALSQQAPFEFNVIVADNGSTDGTREILADLAAQDSRLHVLTLDGTPGIGGCWNRAINSQHAGKFVVQLDSDDVYDGNNVLERVVAKFYERQCAMVVGSYTLTDFDGNIMAPGLIAHPELDYEHGADNALRVNGFGAPRAFFTPIIRDIGFNDVSYGEDYAACLAVSRTWRFGRIYDSLYKCRRWEGNTDHKLTLEQKNRNDHYKDWVRTREREKRKNIGFTPALAEELSRLFLWEGTLPGQAALKTVQKRTLSDQAGVFTLLHLPTREKSARSQKGDNQRNCFLCEENRPKGQPYVDLGEFQILANPAPIFPRHLVIASRTHKPQEPIAAVKKMLELNDLFHGHESLVWWYNGASCGASAPEHLHFQAAQFTLPAFKPTQTLGPVATGFLGSTPCIQVKGDARAINSAFRDFLPTNRAMVSILLQDDTLYIVHRQAHRAASYPRPLVSPGAVEMAGQIAVPLKEDFDTLTAADLHQIMAQVTYPIEHYQEHLTSHGK